MDERELLSIAQQAEQEGDTESAIEAYNLIAQMKQQSPERSLGDKVMGAVETGASVLSGIPAGLAGGLTYAGTLAATGDPQAAEAVKTGTEQALTYQPRGEAGQEYTQAVGETLQEYVGEPLEKASETLGEAQLQRQIEQGASPVGAATAATIDYMIPQALVEAAALFTGGGLSRLARSKADKSKARGQNLERQLDPDNVDYQAAADTIKKANPKDIAELINADPKIINAIEELGIKEEPLASFYSNNPQYRAIEQGLASVDASDLNIQQKNFISELSQKADDIIETYGGTLDKASLGDSIKKDMLNTIDDIYRAEDEVYSNIRKSLPSQTKIAPENTLAYIESYADELGGIQYLDPSLKKLYGDLKQEGGVVNYGLLNDRRSQIGQQLGRKGESVFKNVEQGKLKALYAALKRDQAAALEGTGDPSLRALQESADRLTIQRKTLQENATELLGKDLDRSLMIAVGRGVKGLEKGDLEGFKKTINSIPENRRGEAVLSAMNEAFKGTAASKQQLGEAQFARYWTAINRSPEIKKELFKNLPPDSRRAIENLGEVTNAVYRANQDKITTGRLTEFFEDRGGSINNMANRLMSTSAVSATARISPSAAFAVKELLENSTDQAKAANKMLASGKFKKMVYQAAKDGVNDGQLASKKTKAMEREFMKSKQYQEWADMLDKAEVDRISRVGLVNYLIKPYQEEEKQ